MKERLERFTALAIRRPALTIGIVATLALAGGLLALSLEPSTGSDTFVSRSSGVYQATDQDHRHFGGDPVIILIKEPLPDLVQTRDLATVTFLEACLAGQYVVPSQQLQSFQPAPAGTHAPYGGYGSPCGKLMKLAPVQVVYGPGTFLNRAVAAVNLQIATILRGARQSVAGAESAARALGHARGLSQREIDQAASAAGYLEQQQQTNQLERMYLNSGINGMPRIDDPQFIPQIVFDQTRGVNQPKARFAYLFPTTASSLIQVRLKASLTAAQQAQAISLIRQAVRMPMFRLGYGGAYTVTGAPVVVDDLAAEITGSIGGLLIGAVLVMGAVLLLAFRSRPRLLPLALALGSAGITFGLLSLVGGTLTMASIAVLPILIGLAVDYAIQFQSRAREEMDSAAETGSGPGMGSAAQTDTPAQPGRAVQGVARASALGAPAIAAAALATATGFLVLLLSPLPMVRGFGILLVVGVAVAFACTLSAGSAALVLSDRRRASVGEGLDGGLARRGSVGRTLRAAGALGAAVRRSVRGAGEILRELTEGPRGRLAPMARVQDGRGSVRSRLPRGEAVLAGAMRRPATVLAVGGALALLGWLADTQSAVQSDVSKLVPSSMPALQNLRELERITGVSGEIDVIVSARSVATPETVAWMLDYENRLLAHYGYLETRGCAHSTLCPALSLPDLFAGGASATRSGASGLTQSSINSLLGAVPSYFSQAVISPDRRQATLAFGIRLMPLEKQQQVIEYMRSQLHPPPGVTAQLAGLPVIGAEADAALASPARRLLMLLAGLLAVGAVLLAVFRDVRRAVIPLIPIALATGWSAAILFATGIPLNPMSATLGALVIAISTEFSVLLSERFRQERERGSELRQALLRTYRSTGAAVVASGITVIAGFGVLILSGITMLRDFGFVTLIDLSVSLAGVLFLLPAVLVLAEREDLADAARAGIDRALASLPRIKRRERVA